MTHFYENFYVRTVRVLADKLDEAEKWGDPVEIEHVRDCIRSLDIEIAVNEYRDGGEVEG